MQMLWNVQLSKITYKTTLHSAAL